MELELTVPEEILEKLYGPGGSCTNITSTNVFGNVEDGKANEMTGVKVTKQGAAEGAYESLNVSFYSSHVLARARRKLKAVVRLNTTSYDGDDVEMQKPPRLILKS